MRRLKITALVYCSGIVWQVVGMVWHSRIYCFILDSQITNAARSSFSFATSVITPYVPCSPAVLHVLFGFRAYLEILRQICQSSWIKSWLLGPDHLTTFMLVLWIMDRYFTWPWMWHLNVFSKMCLLSWILCVLLIKPFLNKKYNPTPQPAHGKIEDFASNMWLLKSPPKECLSLFRPL